MSESQKEAQRKITEPATCSTCREVPRFPVIVQCKNSHIVCSMCFKKIAKRACPTCRIPMPDDSSRNRPLEEMIESGAIPVGCQFKDCNFETAYPDIGRHEESCPHGKGQKVLTERDAAIPVTPATTPTAAATATAGGADVAVTVTRSQTSSSSAVDETDGHSIKVNISLTR